MTRSVEAPTAEHLAHAENVIRQWLRPTPVVELELPGGARFWAKLESLQPTGSFKVRGAFAALTAYAPLGRPIVTASAGNHGLAIAYIARRLAIRATVVVSTHASSVKVQGLRALGADLVEAGDDFDAAERHAIRLAEGGATYVSAYNDPFVIAGQSTCAIELFDQLPGQLAIVAPVGGGGLVTGVALVSEARRPGTMVAGSEAAASRAFSTAVAMGEVVTVPIGETIADGLAGNIEAGSMAPRLAATRVAAWDAVTEPEIRVALRLLARQGLTVEPSAAVGVATLMSGRLDLGGRTPVAILTGRNVALDRVAALLRGDGDRL